MNDFFDKSSVALLVLLAIIGVISIFTYFAELSDQKALENFIEKRRIEKIEGEIANIKSQLPGLRPPNTTPGGWSSQ